MEPQALSLDLTAKSPFISELQTKLKKEIVGQDAEIDKLVKIIETFLAGYSDPDIPVGVVMILGPTGVGKTSLITKLSEFLYDNPKSYIRLNCADFKDSYQTNRLIGAPPGYQGFKDKSVDSYLSQEKLDACHTKNIKLTIVLLDEIEKAHTALYEYFLAAFNDGEARVNGNLVSFRNTLFVMTSNLGSRKMTQGIGFATDDLKQIHEANVSSATEAMRKHFESEFINRMDEILVFKPLSKETIDKIFDSQISKIKKRFLSNKKNQPQFVFKVLDSARNELIKEGFNPVYGARPLIRVLKRRIVNELATMVMGNQISYGDLIVIGFEDGLFTYKKYNSTDIGTLTDDEWEEFQNNIK